MDLVKATSMMAARKECHSRVSDIPAVFATSVGFRHIAGVMTDELSICVHVRKKLPPKLAGDKERPVRGGLELQGYGIHYGTLGCMVKDKKNVNYVLSNEHVLGGVGTATYQPASSVVCNQLGWVTKAQSIKGGKMDCAISNLAKHDDGGLPTIKSLGPVIGKCKLLDEVSKSGANTGVTDGSVIDLDYTFPFNGTNVTGQIRVMSKSHSYAFGEEGDSGSAVVVRGTGNEAGTCQVGGLLWAVGSTKSSKVNVFGYITPIDVVLDAMESTCWSTPSFKKREGT